MGKEVKEKKELDQSQDQLDVDLEVMEKSFNDAKNVVLALLGGESESPESSDELEKAKKKPAKDIERDEEEDEEDEEEEEAKKSLEDSVLEDPEAGAAMDVEPFLQQLVKSMDKHFSGVQVTLDNVVKRIDAVETLQKASSQMFVKYGELQESMSKTVEKIGDAPVGSSSILRKSGDRFKKAGDLDMTRTEILDKALELRKAGKLESVDVTKIEGRLNKGMELPDNIMKLLKEGK